MPSSLSNIRIDVSDKIYLKDPNTSDLGKDILAKGLTMIDELGLEKFTFKKLANEIGTTESAVYRYFENKHKLLLYYVSWYWGWLEYNLAFGTANIDSDKKRLETAVKIITRDLNEIKTAPFDLKNLQRVIIAEGAKSYLTKSVDDENKEGLFIQFKTLCERMAQMILQLAPKYPFAHSLASLFIESHLDQLYFLEHLPSLCDLNGHDNTRFDFYNNLIFSSIEKWRV
ncbi:MAG TPA: TetR/AcrR family transcriptional regulator [Cryomorphaceae bacterium]|nr:TetR/AcrR family transcriptional regulator [Cryomorphaceae bacterium]